ncbi:MAG: LuxR C-terminal-related transcriptional regulator [Vulcanimicrobiaceae bacterium]
MNERNARVVIADDHPLFREAMKHVLGAVFGPSLDCTEVASFDDLQRTTPDDDRFDLIVFDLQMPGGDWQDELRALRERAPATPTIVVSSLEDPATVQRVTDSGVAGYLPKSASKLEMEEVLRSVLEGNVSHGGRKPPAMPDFESLTARQVAVLDQLAQGKSNKEIADVLFVEEITVKTHVTAILRKLHVRNRLQAAMVWQHAAGHRGKT